MAEIRDIAYTLYSATTTNMVMEMPTHETGDLLVACVAKDGASNFTTPSTSVGSPVSSSNWTLVEAGTSAGAGGGIYALRASSSSENVTFPLSVDTCVGVVISVKDVFGSTVADAIPTSASGSSDSTLPFDGVGLTTGHANSLLIHMRASDTTAGTSHLPPWVNLASIDVNAGGLCVAYSFEPTASTVVAAPSMWGQTADDGIGRIIEIRDGSGGTVKPPYIPLDVVPSVLISSLNGITGDTLSDIGTYVSAASIAITSVAGKTVSGVTVATTADSGYNPYRGSMRNAGVSSTTALNHTEFNRASPIDVTTGDLIFGTYLHLAPRDFVDTGKTVQGGKYIILGSDTTNWRAWVVGGQFSKTDTPNARVNFLIEPSFTSTQYDSAGTANFTSLDYFAFGSAGYYGAPAILWNELWELRTAVIAGGTTTNPFNFDDLVEMVNSGCGNIPVIQQTGALGQIWIPLQIGGNENVGISCNLRTLQWPRQADELDYVDFHVANDSLGVEFYGTGSSDLIHFTNCVFTSESSYYWRFNGSHSASADIDFSGSTVVNATVTLQSTVTLDNITFISCGEITLNGADIVDSTFSNTRATASQGAVAFTSATESDGIDRGTFIDNNDGDIGHSIRITATGTYTFDGHTFSGGGPAEFSFHTQSDVDPSGETVTQTSHGYSDGDAVYYQDQGGTDTIGLTDGNLYYVNAVTADTLSFYDTKANAIAGGATGRVNLSDGSGGETHYIYSAKADVYNNSGGAVTINVTGGGDTPTVRNSNGSSTTVNNAVTLTVTVVDTSNSPIQNAQTAIYRSSDALQLMNEDTNVSGIATESFNFVSNTDIYIRVRKSTVGDTRYYPASTTGTITSSGFSTTITLIEDPTA